MFDRPRGKLTEKPNSAVPSVRCRPDIRRTVPRNPANYRPPFSSHSASQQPELQPVRKTQCLCLKRGNSNNPQTCESKCSIALMQLTAPLNLIETRKPAQANPFLAAIAGATVRKLLNVFRLTITQRCGPDASVYSRNRFDIPPTNPTPETRFPKPPWPQTKSKAERALPAAISTRSAQ